MKDDPVEHSLGVAGWQGAGALGMERGGLSKNATFELRWTSLEGSQWAKCLRKEAGSRP